MWARVVLCAVSVASWVPTCRVVQQPAIIECVASPAPPRCAWSDPYWTTACDRYITVKANTTATVNGSCPHVETRYTPPPGSECAHRTPQCHPPGAAWTCYERRPPQQQVQCDGDCHTSVVRAPIPCDPEPATPCSCTNWMMLATCLGAVGGLALCVIARILSDRKD
jgi:hypothetical protein